MTFSSLYPPRVSMPQNGEILSAELAVPNFFYPSSSLSVCGGVEGYCHRWRIYTEENAKVLASVWGTTFIQFFAALAISILNNRLNCTRMIWNKFILFFKIVQGKTASRARNSSPKQKRRPLPCLLYKSFFFYGYCIVPTWYWLSYSSSSQQESAQLSLWILFELQGFSCWKFTENHTFLNELVTRERWVSHGNAGIK